jgi:hypothetical protein
MLNEAIEKIKAEMTQNKANSNIQYLGSYLMQHLNAHPEDAKKFIAKGNTIAKCIDEMRKVAEKKKVGNCAMMSPDEGFSIAMGFFGLDEKPEYAMPQPVVAAPAAPVLKTSAVFEVNLDDLLD